MLTDHHTTRPIISFLFGSGFSVPEGLPKVGDINRRLAKIHESEILIHSDMQAFFLNRQNDPNRFIRWEERLFVQEFLEFYNNEILNDGRPFHYESFYDFYAGYLYKKENKELIESFCEGFREKHLQGQSYYSRDCLNCIADFNRTFNQLIAQLLYKKNYVENVGCVNYPPYETFIQFLSRLLEENDLKIHTLNHDLFFDYLGRSHDKLCQHFSDGFRLEGSPYYGTVSFDFCLPSKERVHKNYYVKLERFVDKFDTPLSLFKLHGSIDNNIIYADGSRKERLKTNYGVTEYFQEVEDKENGGHTLPLLHSEIDPDFLSGTTNKIRYYTDDTYYVNLFQHFENNLLNSDKLIVIGYGFQDSGINTYLESHFLSKGKKMIVIDPYKPQTNLIDKYGATYIEKSIIDVTYADFEELR